MLETLRNASDKLWAKILMGVLIFSFVGWGVASWIFGENRMDDSVVTVGDQSVKITEFDREMNRQLAQMSKAMSKEIYTDPTARLYFAEQVLSNLVSRLLLEQRAIDLKLTVSNQYIASIIKNAPEFQENGFFSTEKFDAILYSNQMTEDQFANTLRRQYLRELVLVGLVESSIVPNFFSAGVYNNRYHERRIDYSVIKYDDFKISETPTESDLKKLYAIEKPMMPEYRKISYILVPVKDMKNPDSYDNGYARAQKVEDAIISGEPMKSVAEKFKATYVSREPMTIQHKDINGKTINDPILNDTMINSIFTMESGIESPLMEINSGFLIVRVDQIDTARATPFEKVKESLKTTWIEKQKEKLAYARANDMLSNIKQGKSFKEAAGASSVSSYQMGSRVTRTSTSIFPSEVVTTTFATKPGKTVLAQGNRAFHLVHVIEQVKPTIDTEKMKSIKSESSNMISKMLIDDYTGFLARQYPVHTNERLFNKMFTPQQP